MKNGKDILDDEIRVIGSEDRNQQPTHRKLLIRIIASGCLLLLLGILLFFMIKVKPQSQDEQTYFDPQPEVTKPEDVAPKRLGQEVDSLAKGFVEIKDTTINDIPLRIYIPHNALVSLQVGRLNVNDHDIVFAAQAADIRRDNRMIVGAFVLAGKPLALGLSKRGYCAIINDQITVGVAENSPLFEEATEKNGYFFRQYPLVDNGSLVENEPKNKSIRRALCDRNGEILVVESQSNESFHDFAQALVDLEMTNAIYLVGSSSYGWAVNANGDRVEFGVENSRLPKNTNYIIWRRR